MENIIRKYSFKDGLNHEFEIVDLTKIFASARDMMIVPHRAQFYHIIWIEKGKGTHYVDFKPVEVEDDVLIFVPHNSVNRFDGGGSYEGKGILFTDSFYCKNTNDIQYLNSTMLFSDLYPVSVIKLGEFASELKSFFNAMQTEFLREPDPAQYNILHNLLHVFMLTAEREIRKQGYKEMAPSANLDFVMLFKDLLETGFVENKSVKYYAAELSISEKQLNKATTTLLDKTPKQIIDERIVLEAKRLLAHSTESIKEIAYHLGYNEPTNFIKYFRKHTGTTPSDFRESF